MPLNKHEVPTQVEITAEPPNDATTTTMNHTATVTAAREEMTILAPLAETRGRATTTQQLYTTGWEVAIGSVGMLANDGGGRRRLR